MSSERSDDADRLTDRREKAARHRPVPARSTTRWTATRRSPPPEIAPKRKGLDRIARHKILCWGHEPNDAQHNRQEARRLASVREIMLFIKALYKIRPCQPPKYFLSLRRPRFDRAPISCASAIHSACPPDAQLSHSLCTRAPRDAYAHVRQRSHLTCASGRGLAERHGPCGSAWLMRTGMGGAPRHYNGPASRTTQ